MKDTTVDRRAAGHRAIDALFQRRGRMKDAGDVRIVQNKLLGGWFVVRGASQTPLSGRFNSKEEAQASLKRSAKDLQLSNPCPYCDKPHDPSNKCRLAPVAKSPLKSQLKKSVSKAKDAVCRGCGTPLPIRAQYCERCKANGTAPSYDAFAKRPGKFVKGAKVLVDGKPAVIVHEFGGEDVGWVRVKFDDGKVDEVNVSRVKAADAIQHVAVEPVKGGYQTRVMHGENTAQRQGFGTKHQAERYGERTLAKLAKQAEAPPKFKTWKIAAQASHKGECPSCHQVLETVDGHLVPHTRAYVYGVQKNFKVDPSNKRYRCKGSGAEPVGHATDAIPSAVKKPIFKVGQQVHVPQATESLRSRGLTNGMGGTITEMVKLGKGLGAEFRYKVNGLWIDEELLEAGQGSVRDGELLPV